jgi:hypothetical protein
MELIFSNEFGSIHPIRFLNPSQVKCYDYEGNEIIIPKCDKCNSHKTQVIGKDSFTWVCSCGDK